MDEEQKNQYKLLTIITFAVLGAGILFYHFTEDLSWVDALYFCVVTLTTVGYGDIVPKTTGGKLFTTFYLLVGIGIITAFITTSIKMRAAKIEARRNAKRK